MGAYAVRDTLASADRIRQRVGSSMDALSDVLEDGRATMKQIVKTTRNKTEDLLYDASRNIKRSPLSSVLVAFGIGAVVGVMIGAATTRR